MTDIIDKLLKLWESLGDALQTVAFPNHLRRSIRLSDRSTIVERLEQLMLK